VRLSGLHISRLLIFSLGCEIDGVKVLRYIIVPDRTEIGRN
jgi:hypothetical protein